MYEKAPASYDDPVVLRILRRQGAFLLRYYGTSNFSNFMLTEVCPACTDTEQRRLGLHRQLN